MGAVGKYACSMYCMQAYRCTIVVVCMDETLHVVVYAAMSGR